MTAILVGGNINAFADGNIDIANPTSSGSGYVWDSPTLTITHNGDYTFTGATTANRIAVNPNLTAVSITLENVTIKSIDNCAFSIGSGSTVYLTLKGIDTLKSGDIYAGLQAPSGAKLFIDGPGALNVTGGRSGGAGIGSKANSVSGSSGHITINGGTVTATGGGSYGAGIGGGNNDKGVITINDGTVVATGSRNGASIGGGGNSGGTIIITHGVVTATSTNGAGIGSGSLSYNSNGIVTITGGTVMATSYDGAGIGGGSNSSGTIVIDSGTVTATSAKGAGIGGGSSSSGTIVIDNGTVTATSSEGAGIGGGTGGSGSITINSGTVDATSGIGAGIGTGSSGSGSNDGNVTIKGGMVTAKSKSSGAGIGCGFSNLTTCKITIAGGIVAATSEYGAGVGSDELGNISEVTISGGSIDASSANNAGIGNNNDPAQSTVRIDGGSVKASGRGSAVSPQPENSNNTPVYLNELTLGYSPVKNTPVAKGSIDDVPCDTLPAAATGVYGIKDVETDDASKLYFWLPETSTPQIISVTANDTTYDNMFSRNADNSNADTLYKAPAVITSVTHIGGQDTSGMILATFSRPMPTGSTGDTVMLVCRECLTSEIVLPPSTGAWSGNRLYKIPFSGLEYSSTYRVYVMGFRDTIGRTVEKDTAHTITTKLMQSITPAAYNTESPYVVGDTIIAEKGEYTANNGGDEGSHSYQWYRSDDGVSAGNPISGANDSIYIPSDEDFGKYIYIATTPVGSEGHKVRPVSSDKIRIGVKITAGVKGGHGGAALFSNGKSDTVAYDDTRMELFLRKNFAADTLLGWSDCYADGDTAWGIFSISPDTSYAVPGKPKGDITLTATLGLPAPKLTFPVASSITYGDMLKQSVLTGGTCSCKGSFAWVAGDTTLRAGVHSLPVAFTPNDQDYDYSSLSGWNESSGTVRRPVEVTVNKKEISIAGGSVEKTYDGDVSATVDSLLFYGLVAGDTLRPGRDYSVNDAKFDTPDAGSGDKTVTLTAELLPSDLASNYTLTNGTDYPLTGQSIDKISPTTDLLEYTLSDTTYDGKQKPVAVEAGSNVEGLGSITVFYNGDATPPVNAGDYTVSVKIEGGANYSHDSLTLGTFTIGKADPTIDLLSYAPGDFDVTYDGAPQLVDVEKQNGVEGLGDVTTLYNGNTTPPVNAGTYAVTVKIENGENYNDATFTLGDLAIQKAEPTTDLLEYTPKEVTYNGAPQPVSVKELDELGSITVFYNGEATPPINAGNYPITVKIEEGDNYNAITLTLENPLTISKAQLTPDDLQFSPIRVTYDDTPHGVTVTPSFPCPEPCRSIGNITVTYNGDERKPVDTGKYAVAVTVAEGDNYKSVTIPMELGIFQIRSATILYDSICINEAYANNGFVLPVQLESGWFTHADTIREELYDSIVQLKLKVCEQIRFSVKNASACADDTKVEVEYELEPGSGIPSYYSATFDKAQNFFTTDVEDALPAAIPMPDNVRPDIYSGALRLSNDKCISEAQPFSITVNYPSSVMKQKWSNVIAIYKGKYEFSAFQWLKNDVEVPGATLPYLYTPPMLDFTATYSVRLTRADDGVTLPACPCKVSPQAQEEKEENIAAYPTITSKGGALTVISLQQGEAITRNTFGNEVSRQKFNAGMSSIVAPGQTGMYFVELYATGKKSRIVKILVK
ncbi:MAG: MBG domain-containing protein [Prevotellaceae bacterium]|nr:MBG domain-containing protein [Prevotellaceae bacterium]